MIFAALQSGFKNPKIPGIQTDYESYAIRRSSIIKRKLSERDLSRE